MGNVPTKESQNNSSFRRSSSSSSSSINDINNISNTSSANARDLLSRDLLLSREFNGSNIYKLNSSRKFKKDKDKLKLKEQKLLDLIVKYEDNVDGGYLAPYGNYKFSLDYKTDIVRDLIIKRKLAPFYTPLQDFDENWSDDELIEYVKNSNIHTPVSISDLENEDEEDPDDHKIHHSINSIKRKENKLFKKILKEKAILLQNDYCKRYAKDLQIQKNGIKIFENLPSNDLLITIYRKSEECPICFLYYPPMMNYSRCCVQPICTECFVQMKRPDPHPPHDEENNHSGSNNSTNNNPQDLISEPVKCPFCAMPNFGITYNPPNFKTGIDGRHPSEFRSHAVLLEESDDLTSTIPIINNNVNNSHSQKGSISLAMSKSHSAIGTPPRQYNMSNNAQDKSYLDPPISPSKLLSPSSTSSSLPSSPNRQYHQGNPFVNGSIVNNHQSASSISSSFNQSPFNSPKQELESFPQPTNSSNILVDIGSPIANIPAPATATTTTATSTETATVTATAAAVSYSNKSQYDQSTYQEQARKRRGSLPPNSPGVITIDFIRPDWEQKLFNARSRFARRSAAATALHASSLIIQSNDSTGNDNNSNNESSNGRSSTSRRGSSNSHNHHQQSTYSYHPDLYQRVSRHEQQQLEEKMIEQALKLSLLDEEERQLKERQKKNKS
ncbi:hypothetical protein BVG19_g4185 [[Candida] boidinii]|nr:hypothetical protein BVG19_g4185 [[Candida] boidinii]OWB53052.1 hypothetical protein B5S27_g4639 [[Candida] boidinii]